MYHLHTHCRACGYASPGAQGTKASASESLKEVFDLGIQPLANDFRKTEEERAGFAPLKVLLCPQCNLAQLSVVVNPDILYRHYSYVTSTSKMMQNHFESLTADIASETEGLSVLEIGSNDGTLLAHLQTKGYSVLGVDPAENLTNIARKRGILSTTGLFGAQLSESLGVFDVVIARHVFCHVDDWQDFIAGLENVTHSYSVVCIEVPYVGDLLRKCEFDTIYHEHLSYFSIEAMNALLSKSQLRIHRIVRYPIHGGTLLVMLRRCQCPLAQHPSVSEFKESITLETWQEFAEEAECQIGRLRSAVRTFRAQGKRVAGLGASAKSTVWVNACGFKKSDIAFIADNTIQKQYTFSPGSDIPIIDEGAILRELPDYVVIFCWNYLGEILDKFSVAREKGVKFIVPVPKIDIV